VAGFPVFPARFTVGPHTRFTVGRAHPPVSLLVVVLRTMGYSRLIPPILYFPENPAPTNSSGINNREMSETWDRQQAGLPPE